MIIKEGAGRIRLYVKPRVDGRVLTIAEWEAQYGGTPESSLFSIIAETADKTENQVVEGTADKNGILFVLPADMFTKSQRDWTAVVMFTINEVNDFSLYNIDIKVTKGDSPNSR